MGENLKRLRLRAGLTQQEVAEALHVTQGSVCHFFDTTVDFLINE